jgi:hypothetical protein
MYALLLALGIISVAIGTAAIGFGVPNYAFDLGNTLFIAGSVWLIGGMVLVGLAAAVRQLRRIADGMGRPVVRRQPAPEGADAQRAQAARIPYPPKPGADARDPRAPEPRPAAAPDGPEAAPPERPRPNILGVARGANGTRVMDEPDAVPLAPTRGPAPPVGRDAPMGEPASDPRLASSDLIARLSNLAASSRPAPRPEPPRLASPAERQRPNMFDAVWPADVRAGRSRAETIARAPRLDTMPEAKPEGMLEARPEPKLEPEPRQESKPEPSSEPGPEPKFESRPEARAEPKFQPKRKPEPRFEPPLPRERIEPSSEPRDGALPVPSPAVQEPRAIAILKSGVIDGMAYTLYTDGSIEAELPQGTMRFSSIDDLRAHLEKAERPE